MCFLIDHTAPKPTTKFAYKVFVLNDLGEMVSRYSSRRQGYVWELGKEREIRTQEFTPRVRTGWGNSEEGLHAYPVDTQ